MSRQATTAEEIITAMAYNREAFKDKVEEKVGGALLEYYKARLARAAGQTRWVTHWQAEAARLLDTELVVVLLHGIKGFKDRRKAAREVLQRLRGIEDQYRRAAEHVVQRDYGLKKLSARITDEMADTFFRRVDDIVATYTGGEIVKDVKI